LQQPFHPQTQAGTTTKSNLAAHKDSLKLATIVSNAILHMSSIRLLKDAYHAQLTTPTMRLPSNAIAKFHVSFQGNLTVITYVNAHLIQKEEEEFGTNLTTHVVVLKTSHCGTVNIALFAQPILNLMPKRSNAIIAQTDSSEITAVKLVFQDFDLYNHIYLVLIHFEFVQIDLFINIF
jgi:hypothetical protein